MIPNQQKGKTTLSGSGFVKKVLPKNLYVMANSGENIFCPLSSCVFFTCDDLRNAYRPGDQVRFVSHIQEERNGCRYVARRVRKRVFGSDDEEKNDDSELEEQSLRITAANFHKASYYAESDLIGSVEIPYQNVQHAFEHGAVNVGKQLICQISTDSTVSGTCKYIIYSAELIEHENCDKNAIEEDVTSSEQLNYATEDEVIHCGKVRSVTDLLALVEVPFYGIVTCHALTWCGGKYSKNKAARGNTLTQVIQVNSRVEVVVDDDMCARIWSHKLERSPKAERHDCGEGVVLKKFKQVVEDVLDDNELEVIDGTFFQRLFMMVDGATRRKILNDRPNVLRFLLSRGFHSILED